MAQKQKKRRIAWYRSPASRADLSRLNQRSDFKGFLQAGGYLGLLVLTGASAYFSVGYLPWPLAVAVFFFHGTCYAFLGNGFHELAHDSVFKTKWLNRFFLCFFSFLGWHNHIHYWASHTEHHKYTLHPPDDLEVVVPTPVCLKAFLKMAVVQPFGIYHVAVGNIKLGLGRVEGEWSNHLFPASDVKQRRRMRNWALIVLLGHGTIVAISLLLGLWWLPVVVTLAPFYGGGLLYLCNNTQHTGLPDNTADFRLCCRTITLSPFVRFLYWHMNYHTEHHMYAAVPCYNLGKLHKLIRDDLPYCPHGLFATWKQIIGIIKEQKVDADYQYVAELPASELSLGHAEVGATVPGSMQV